MKKQTAIVTSSVPSFESLLQRMTPHFQFFAKRVLKLRGDDFDDVLQELSAIAYELYLSLVKRGKEIFYTPLLKFAIKRYREGRRFIGSNSTDALSDKTKLMGGCAHKLLLQCFLIYAIISCHHRRQLFLSTTHTFTEGTL